MILLGIVFDPLFFEGMPRMASSALFLDPIQ